MSFNPNIPQPGDLLTDSQGDILVNNQTADASFLVDHFTFSDMTVDNGKHRQVSSPVQASDPATTTDPKLYGFQPSVPIGVLQFSKPPNDALHSPVTKLQAPAAGVVVGNGASTNVVDLTGLTRAYGKVFAMTTNTMSLGVFRFNGGGTLSVDTSYFQGFINTLLFTADVPNNIVQINNLSGGIATIFWTLEIWRVQ